MFGLMQERPLLIASIIQHAARHHGGTEVVSRLLDGTIHRTTYRDLERARPAAGAGAAAPRRSVGGPGGDAGLERLPPSGAVLRASPAWARSATPSIRGCRPTTSPTSSTTRRIAVLFADTSFTALIEAVGDEAGGASARRGAAVRGRRRCRRSPCPRASSCCATKTLMDAADEDFVWPSFDERTAACALLHVGHHRAAEGRAVQPPLHRAARDGAMNSADVFGAARERPGAAGGADVPRQRLGHRPMPRRWPARRWSCRGGISTAPAWPTLMNAERVTRLRRRADGLARAAAASARQRRAAGDGAGG